MTKKQIEFLRAIYNGEKTAKELCEELGITPSKNDPIGGYYNSLNEFIDYLTYDGKSEIEDMFKITPYNGPESNYDIYTITQRGKKYIEDL